MADCIHVQWRTATGVCAWNGSTDNSDEFTESTIEFERTFALESTDEIDTGCAIHAWVTGAVIDLGFAEDPRISSRTETLEGVDHVHTCTIVLTAQE